MWPPLKSWKNAKPKSLWGFNGRVSAMRTRRRTVLEDRDTMTRLRNTRSKKISVNEIEYSDPIPIDLIIEILSRLPAKSIAICRCVSKLWASIILRPYFTELFLTRSWCRPQLLFACHENGEFVFMSSPQPQNPDEISSSVVPNNLKRFSFDGLCEISGLVHGLVCLSDLRISNGRKETKLMICNPSTGQSIPLPKVRTRRVGVNSYLGYDPIDKRFKVLSMTSLNYVGRSVFDEHQILTLGTGNKPSWRKIECCTPHYSTDQGICINGVLYYLAGVDKYSSLSMIVCFDVRSEQFRFIKIVEAMFRKVGRGALLNYNGKLGVFVTQNHGSVDGRNGMSGGNIDLWVLEDAEKQEWSKNTYVLPALWQNTLGTTCLRFVGMTRTNEIVFSSVDRTPFSIFYYNLERNTIIKVGFQGLEVFKNKFVYKFLDHVENVKFMQV